MVKSVVKPLKMRFLQERIVPKKSMFVRAFSVFRFEMPWRRCLAPKRRALPTAPHPVFVHFIIAEFWEIVKGDLGELGRLGC